MHRDASIKGSSTAAEEAFAAQYPAVYEHLASFKQQLSARNAAETGIRYEWYALQRFGSNYYEEFEKPKIIYPNMTSVLPFVYDKGAFYTNQKCFIITGERLGYLTAFFNSKLFRYCFKSNFPELPGVTRELSKVFFDQIPVKPVSDEQEAVFMSRVEWVQTAKQKGVDTTHIEEEIELLLADLYGLEAPERDAVTASTD